MLIKSVDFTTNPSTLSKSFDPNDRKYSSTEEITQTTMVLHSVVEVNPAVILAVNKILMFLKTMEHVSIQMSIPVALEIYTHFIARNGHTSLHKKKKPWTTSCSMINVHKGPFFSVTGLSWLLLPIAQI